MKTNISTKEPTAKRAPRSEENPQSQRLVMRGSIWIMWYLCEQSDSAPGNACTESICKQLHTLTQHSTIYAMRFFFVELARDVGQLGIDAADFMVFVEEHATWVNVDDELLLRADEHAGNRIKALEVALAERFDARLVILEDQRTISVSALVRPKKTRQRRGSSSFDYCQCGDATQDSSQD